MKRGGTGTLGSGARLLIGWFGLVWLIGLCWFGLVGLVDWFGLVDWLVGGEPQALQLGKMVLDGF